MHEIGRPLQAPHFARRNLEAPPSPVKKTQCDICGGFRGRNGLTGQGFFGFPLEGFEEALVAPNNAVLIERQDSRKPLRRAQIDVAPVLAGALVALAGGFDA